MKRPQFTGSAELAAGEIDPHPMSFKRVKASEVTWNKRGLKCIIESISNGSHADERVSMVNFFFPFCISCLSLMPAAHPSLHSDES